MPARRLPEFDYATEGAYYVTICAHGRALLFLDPIVSVAVAECWNQILSDFAVELDEFVVMPYHVHGIVWITAGHARPLPVVVGSFKSAVSRRINARRGSPGGKVWQRGCYEHVIRDGADLERIRDYISTNPARWDADPENPAARRERP